MGPVRLLGIPIDGHHLRTGLEAVEQAKLLKSLFSGVTVGGGLCPPPAAPPCSAWDGQRPLDPAALCWGRGLAGTGSLEFSATLTETCDFADERAYDFLPTDRDRQSI